MALDIDDRQHAAVDREVDFEQRIREHPRHRDTQYGREDSREHGKQQILQTDTRDDLRSRRTENGRDRRIRPSLLPSRREAAEQHKQAIADREPADSGSRERS